MKNVRPLWFRTLSVVTIFPLIEWLKWLTMPHDAESMLSRMIMWIPALVFAEVVLAWQAYPERHSVAYVLLALAWMANACVIAVRLGLI